ncbi:hypothetical protein ABEW05_003148 [Botrytis cinerea]
MALAIEPTVPPKEQGHSLELDRRQLSVLKDMSFNIGDGVFAEG